MVPLPLREGTGEGLLSMVKSATPPPNPLPQGEGGLKAQLANGLKQLGVDESCAPALLAYLDELQKWNAAYNLTAVREPREMVTRHLLDSLVMCPYVKMPLLDVGSGAGLPGIPLAIALPELRVTVLDSNGKKARFLRHAARALKLGNVEVVEARVEDYRPEQPFAAVTSRAFASLKDFFSLTGHLLAPDGEWLAMKGKLDDSETQDLPAGVGIVDIKTLKVPGLAEARHLVVAKKA
jgi:16S rRNA (guanine527-N7)-methyltransferase